MIDYKNKTKVIGFDLDQTLYPKSPEIDEAIQKYIYEKIAASKKCSLGEARALFADLYKDGAGMGGSKALATLEIPNGKEIVQEALERADIASFLVPNPETINLLKKLKEKYKNLDVITGSNGSITHRKLKKLDIGKEIFSHIITKDDASKSDGSAYKIWLSFYDLPPENFLYIGDRVMSDYEVPKNIGVKSILVNIKEKNDGVDCPQLSSLLELEKYL